jgi:DNA-binding GntR family transcriptional regulator
MKPAAGLLSCPRGRLADEVCREIADGIVLGRFAPNARLDETMLAAMFGVSRTPVREALKLLVATGLATCRPNRGTMVAGLSSDQLEQMFEAIGELEAACARHAALRMDASGHACLRALHGGAREAMRDQDIDRYDAVNRELHAAVVRGAGNPVLSGMATQLKNRAAPYRRTQFRDLDRMRASFEEHSAIVEAILAHDAAMAYREMRAHLLSAHSAAARLRRERDESTRAATATPQ